MGLLKRDMKKIEYFSLFLILVSLILSIYFYPSMPDKMASHWNSSGEVDGFMSKNFVLFLFPVISLFIGLLLMYIPRIDPLKQNFKSFEKEYDLFVLTFLVFFISIQLFVIYWNLGYHRDIRLIISMSLSILFIVIGLMLKKTKRNFFVGIRTPWTLSSDVVWDKTHKIGGYLFILLGFIFAFSLFLKEFSIHIILSSIFIVIVSLFIYSYIIFKRLKK